MMIDQNTTVVEKKSVSNPIDTIGCTFDKMGKYQFVQPTYECSNCYLNNICYQCINVCHLNCRAQGQNAQEIEMNSKFICKCGQQFCHKVDKKKGMNEKEPCKMMKIDEILNLKKKYFCEDHNVEVCSLCAANCHNDYSCRRKFKTIDLENETEGSLPLSCKCDHVNHSKFYFSTFEDLHYDALKFENNLQAINTIMKTKVISNKDYTLSIFEKKAYIDDDFLKYLVVFLELMVNSEYKPHFLVRELRDSFPFEESRKHLSLFKPEGLKQIYIKIYIITLIYFLNIKRDFWKMKVLTFSDFRTNSISFRINYRKYLFDKNNSNPNVKNLHKKYLLHQEETSNSISEINTLKGLVLNLIDSLHLQIKENTSVDFSWFKNTFKFIKFSLLNMIFTKGELNLLISSFYEYFKTFNQIFDKKEIKHDNFNMLCLPKILFLICVNYNDLVISENLSKNIKENLLDVLNLQKEKVNHFIHYENEHTEKLLKLIILYKKFYAINLEPYNSNEKKMVAAKKTIDDCLNMFLNFDNIYFEQVKSLKRETKVSYNSNISQFNDEIEKGEISPFNYLKIIIEKNIEDFFYYNIEGGKEINVKVFYNNTVNSIKQFIESFDSESFYSVFNKIHKNSNKITADQNTNKKILKYQEGLCQKLKKTFPQISFILENRHKLEIFVKMLIESSLDNTITYFFKTFRKKYNNLEFSDIDIIFDFLSFFLLSKAGFIYLIAGGNLVRIMTLLSSTPKEVVKFISYVIKFSKIYQVDLKHHKIINIIKEQILKVNVRGNDNQLIQKITQKLKIINYLEDSFEYEEYEDLKKILFKEIVSNKQKIKFFNKEDFIKVYEEAEKVFQTKIGSLNLNQLQKSLQEEQIDNGFDMNNGIPNIDFENDKENLLLLKQNNNSLKKDSSKINESQANKNNESKFEIHSINNDLDLKDEIIAPILSKINKENSSPTNFPSPISSQLDEENENIEMKNSECYQMYRFFFAFFKLLSKNSFFYYYIYNKNTKDEEDVHKFVLGLMEIINEYFLKAKCRLLTINKRSILLCMIRTFYFSDHIHSENIDKKLKQLTNEEFITVNMFLDTKFGKLMNNKISNEKYESEIKPKYERLLKFKQIIEIFIEELKNLDFTIVIYSRRGVYKEKFDEYAYELLISIKHISDFILSEDVWNGIYSSLYDLAEILFTKARALKKLLNIYSTNNQNNLVSEIEIHLPYPDLFSSKDKNYQSSNKLEKNLIYRTISDIFSQIMGYTDQCTNLSVVLENLDKFNLLNFSSYSIGDPERYKHFYNLKRKKKVHNKFNENNLKLIKIALKPFKSQMADFENSSFLKLISTKNLDLEFDYEKEIIKYIEIEFFNTNVIPRKEVLKKIMLLNYLLFYDTDAVQNKLCYLLDGKDKIITTKKIKDEDEKFEENEKQAETGVSPSSSDQKKEELKVPQEKKEELKVPQEKKEESKESLEKKDESKDPQEKKDEVNKKQETSEITNVSDEKFNDNYAYLYFWAKLNRILNKSLVLNYVSDEKFNDNYAYLYFWAKLNRILNKSLVLNYSYSSRKS
jgi:hypothetical protein